jgi:hypothetical protein
MLRRQPRSPARRVSAPQALDRGQQGARLGLDAELAQARAGIVIGDPAVVARFDPLETAHVGQERHQLMGARRQGLRPGSEARILVEQGGIVVLDHAGAGARGRDHVVEALESRDHVGRDGLGVRAVARVVGRLSAAGLDRRRLDPAAGPLQELDRRQAHAGADEVDQAGDEKPDGG